MVLFVSLSLINITFLNRYLQIAITSPAPSSPFSKVPDKTHHVSRILMKPSKLVMTSCKFEAIMLFLAFLCFLPGFIADMNWPTKEIVNAIQSH
ncbi:hypothetical protein RJ60_11270 [Mesotoga sp. B105.6.4]|nr:hypothetical protein RJ60_11270 [Mesotoga sp. B105.6.4]